MSQFLPPAVFLQELRLWILIVPRNTGLDGNP